MTTIRPFQALRPAPALAAKIAALPYDVYSREEARLAAEANPLSFLCIDRPEKILVKLLPDLDPSRSMFYILLYIIM